MARLAARITDFTVDAEGTHHITFNATRSDGQGVETLTGQQMSVTQTTYDATTLNEQVKQNVRSAFFSEEVGDTVILSGGFS